MPQYPRSYRPVRNLRSLDRLEGLANQFADLDFRNDQVEQQRQSEVNRIANARRMKTGLFDQLSTEPNMDVRNRSRERAALDFQEVGVDYSPRYETAPKITEPKQLTKKNLVEREIGIIERDKKKYRQLVDVDPTTVFDPKNIPAGTPIREEYIGDIKDSDQDKDPFMGKTGLRKSQVQSYIQQLENKNNDLNIQIEELDSSIKRNPDGSLEIIQDGKPVIIPAAQAKQYSEAIERQKLPAKSGRLNNLLQLIEYKKMIGDKYDNFEEEVKKLREEISGKRGKVESVNSNKKTKILTMPDGSKIEVEIE